MAKLKKIQKQIVIEEPKALGRPSKYSIEIAEAIIALTETIGYVALASERMGVSRRTAYEWIKLGEAGDERFIEFATGIAAAKSRRASKLIKEVYDPKWLLQKLDRETFGDDNSASTVVNVQQNNQVITKADALAELKKLAESDPQIAELLKSLV